MDHDNKLNTILYVSGNESDTNQNPNDSYFLFDF
jgi:hypothetical protein